jgi:hypothetical protein
MPTAAANSGGKEELRFYWFLFHAAAVISLIMIFKNNLRPPLWDPQQLSPLTEIRAASHLFPAPTRTSRSYCEEEVSF